jgi:hypothetical protein
MCRHVSTRLGSLIHCSKLPDLCLMSVLENMGAVDSPGDKVQTGQYTADSGMKYRMEIKVSAWLLFTWCLQSWDCPSSALPSQWEPGLPPPYTGLGQWEKKGTNPHSIQFGIDLFFFHKEDVTCQSITEAKNEHWRQCWVVALQDPWGLVRAFWTIEKHRSLRV